MDLVNLLTNRREVQAERLPDPHESCTSLRRFGHGPPGIYAPLNVPVRSDVLFGMRSLSLLVSASLFPTTVWGQLLPVGDGHVTDHPEVGNVYSCTAMFRSGGARHAGTWFHGDLWNPTEKPRVAGRVYWPEAAFSLLSRDGVLSVESNGLPVEEPTGIFPISRSDSVYRYDTNPNRIAVQDLSFEISANPVQAAEARCLPMGMIGFTTTGVAIYNALDDAGRDAAAHEVQDLCDGHPQARGQYHYHSASPCLPGADSGDLVGWALDGFPILGMHDAQGTLLTNTDLDACHGREESVAIDGRVYAYAYHLTREYPYTLGCFTGVVPQATLRELRGGMGPLGPRSRGIRRKSR